MKRIIVLLLLTITISICTFGGYSFSLPETGTDGPSHSKTEKIPLYGLFETQIENKKQYKNPFTDVALNAVFTSPSGTQVPFLGFFDGDGKGGQEGTVWKQRFMPDEVGKWSYEITFSDGAPGASGDFECVEKDAKPGFWTLDPQNPHWFKTIRGERFMPVSMHASCALTPIDWQDAIEWCRVHEYNTIVTRTMNHSNWPDGYHNVTAFATADESKKEVDYDRMNLRMWHEWDQMLQAAGDAGVYIGPFEGPNGKYGGQERGKYPPTELVMNPGIKDRFNTERNLQDHPLFCGAPGSFLEPGLLVFGFGTEVYAYGVKDEQEFMEYGEYFASITPWGRMITAQDCEQWHGKNRRWLSKLNIPVSRKLNALQTSIENPTRPSVG